MRLILELYRYTRVYLKTYTRPMSTLGWFVWFFLGSLILGNALIHHWHEAILFFLVPSSLCCFMRPFLGYHVDDGSNSFICPNAANDCPQCHHALHLGGCAQCPCFYDNSDDRQEPA